MGEGGAYSVWGRMTGKSSRCFWRKPPAAVFRAVKRQGHLCILRLDARCGGFVKEFHKLVGTEILWWRRAQ
jgi:hypothetical protein